MTQEEVPPPTQPEPPQGQAPQLQADEPSASKAGRPWGETVRKVAVVALAILSYLILADAAIETIFSGAPLRWIVLGTVAAYGGASAALWRYLNWFTRAVATLGVLLAIAAGTAWLPGGLTHGIAMLGQPTSTVLAVVTGVALLMAAAILTRWNVVPLWGRTALGFIALYGLVALVSGIVNRVSYSDLFQGRSEWQRLPFWLQGAFLGALFLTGVFLVNLVYGLIQVRRRALR